MTQYSYLARVTIFILSIVASSISTTAQELVVGWHDHMYLRPGDSVRLNRQQEPAFPALIGMNPTGNTTGNTGDQQTYAAFAQHTYNLLSSLSANASVCLNFSVFSGDADFSFFRRQKFSANDLSFVVTYKKNFGTTRFQPLTLSSDFATQAATLQQQGLQGANLYSALTHTFGTHYVAGYSSSAIVSVVYSIHSASAAVKQTASLSVNASWASGDFSSFVSSKVLSTNTSSFINYQFYSTDPSPLPTNVGFSAAGTITNLQQFSIFTSNVQAYANSLTQTNAKITGYVLDPLWLAGNLILPMLNGYVPTEETVPNYDRFLQDYDALQSYKQTLDPWMLDGAALSWLNAQGQQLVRNDWISAVNYLAAMKTVAINHFTKGVALTVPPDAATFLANLNAITLPSLYIIDSFVDTAGTDSRVIIGRVDCGCRNLTIPIPFSTVSELYYETNRPANQNYQVLAPIYYDPINFQKAQTNTYTSGITHTHLINLFNGVTGQWNCLTNPALNPDLNGYFLAKQYTTDAPHYSLAISSGTDANSNPVLVDEMSFLDTTSGDCPGSCLITLTNLTSGTP